MQIDGKIEGEIIISDDTVKYHISIEGSEYHVMSQNKQAVKDAVFLREGQRISICGTPKGELIIVKDAKIDIRMTGEKNDENTSRAYR